MIKNPKASSFSFIVFSWDSQCYVWEYQTMKGNWEEQQGNMQLSFALPVSSRVGQEISAEIG